MKKWLVAFSVIVIIGVFLVPAFATATKSLTPDTQKEVDALWQQMQDIRAKMMQEYVDAGVITQEQADAAAERMKERYEARKEQGIVPGMGACGVEGGGCGNGGGGCGMGGPGRGVRGQYAPQNNIY